MNECIVQYHKNHNHANYNEFVTNNCHWLFENQCMLFEHIAKGFALIRTKGIM